MGEKLMAQRIMLALRETEGGRGKAARVLLEWAEDQRDWLWPDLATDDGGGDADAQPLCWRRLPELAAGMSTCEPEPALFGAAAAVARLLDLDEFDSGLLLATAALNRSPRLPPLRARLLGAGLDLVALLGRLAGAAPGEAAARVRRSEALRLGLIELAADCGSGALDVELDWTLGEALDRGMKDENDLIRYLIGVPQKASLMEADFAELGATYGLLVRLLRGALAGQAKGVNILIHGPPGTGKTELARTLGASAGARLFAIGEGECGHEPNRRHRLNALTRGQRLLRRRGDSLLLFDEMQDLFAGSESRGDARKGSKIFLNRLFEENAVPTIWTSNDIGDVDAAHLRRMSYILRMDHPSPRARARIAAHAARAEGAEAAAAGLAPLLACETESASVARVALRTAALAGGDGEDAASAARSLLLGLRGGRSLAPAPAGGTLDLSLYSCDIPIEALIERLARPGAPGDFSLLLTGPPGTGKTALAAHLAARLDRPLKVKRASDLLGKWLGETEANIASAFAEARDEGAVLLFDEADSLLLDRAHAQRSWEITQVNELLTWMDAHPLPFIAATNYPRRLDPAALRRFVFKLALEPLSGEAAARAFERFFGRPAPAGLDNVANLTPGDFAVVARQLRYRPEAGAEEVLALLEAEAGAKPEQRAKLGF